MAAQRRDARTPIWSPWRGGGRKRTAPAIETLWLLLSAYSANLIRPATPKHNTNAPYVLISRYTGSSTRLLTPPHHGHVDSPPRQCGPHIGRIDHRRADPGAGAA